MVVVGGAAVGILDDGGPGPRATGPATWPRPSPARSATGSRWPTPTPTAARASACSSTSSIAEGASDAQIRDELAAAYGERVLLTPGRSGVSSLVWALPVVVLVVAVAGLAFAFRRWRGDAAGRASDADRALVARARTPDGAETPS